MNRYKVTATRSNGTELSDYFIEATEGAARKTFKECYRNEEYSDVKVELVAEYVQATKEQEREALAKIVKIIEGLGPGSYVGIGLSLYGVEPCEPWVQLGPQLELEQLVQSEREPRFPPRLVGFTSFAATASSACPCYTSRER